MSRQLPISLVIATVGGETLTRTLESIQAGSHVPQEIIISLPPGVKIAPQKYNDLRLVYVNSPERGQVFQRIYGYEHCSAEMVMQADDDVAYGERSMYELWCALFKLGPGSAVGPAILCGSSGKSVTRYKNGVRGFFGDLYNTLVCLAPWGKRKMGTISPIGIAYGVDWTYLDADALFPVDWLPGGCSLTYKSDLINENYFPFSGKAYGEDIVQSIYRTRRGINMYVSGKAKVFWMDDAQDLFDWSSKSGLIRSHKFILNLKNGNRYFFYIWMLLFSLRAKIKVIFRGHVGY